MLPLGIFLLACAAVYLGAIDAGFSALMRLSLRLVAERSNRPGALGEFLDDPLLLFLPVRLLIGLVTAAATALIAFQVGVDGAHRVTLIVVASMASLNVAVTFVFTFTAVPLGDVAVTVGGVVSGGMTATVSNTTSIQ